MQEYDESISMLSIRMARFEAQPWIYNEASQMEIAYVASDLLAEIYSVSIKKIAKDVVIHRARTMIVIKIHTDSRNERDTKEFGPTPAGVFALLAGV